MWNSVPATLLVEGVMLAGGDWVYARVTRANDRIGTRGLVGLLGLTLAVYLAATFGPSPPSITAVAVTDMGLWVAILVAAWVDRHRRALAAN